MHSEGRAGRTALAISWRHGLRVLLVVAAWCLGAGQAAAAAYSFVPDPAWAQLDVLPKSSSVVSATDGSRYLLVVDQVDLNGQRHVWHRRVAYDVVQERALASAGQFTIQYQPDYQQVQIHAIEVWRGDRRLDRSKDSRIEVLRRESDLETRILDGSHTLSITIPDLRVGDRVEYRYSVVGSNPVFGDHYFDYYTARYGDPVGLRRVRFRYPQHLDLHWNPPVAGFNVKRGLEGTMRTLDFVGRNLAKIREDENLPGSYDAYGKIEVSTAADWRAVSDWALPLYRPVFTDRRLANELVRELKLDRADAEGSLLRAVAFVQGDIRYTALDMGQNSHAPNRPESTVARRFGDCKDKAVLLVALLAEAGIAADPILVHTDLRDGVKLRLPSALAFNHVVVRARLADGMRWVDATRDREVGRIGDRDPMPFGYGLPISSSTLGLVEIPDPLPTLPLVEVSQEIKIRIDGDKMVAGFGVVTDYRRGYGEGIGANFADNGAEEVGRKYLAYMRDFYDDLESVGEPAIEMIDASNAARTSESYRLAWDKAETTLFGIVLFQLADWLPSWKNEKRVGPIALAGPRFARQSIRTRLDSTWDVPAETEIVKNRYFSFQRNIRVDDGDLLVTGEWRRFENQIPASDYAAARRDMEKARDLLTFDVDLDATYAITATGWADWIWAVLGLVLALLGCTWAWLKRSGGMVAGTFFRPGRTAMGLVSHPGSLSKGLLIIAIASLLGGALETASRGHTALEGSTIGYVAGWGFSYVLRLVVFVGLLKLAFHCLAHPVRYRALFVAGCWSAIPGTFLLACSMLSVAGRLRVFAADFAPITSDLPGLLVAGALALLAVAWAAFSALSAYAGAANCSRRLAFGAIMLAGLFAVMSVFVVLAIVSAVK